MAPEVRFYPRAREDLVEQASYLAEQASARVVERFLDAVERTAAGLARMPTKGRPWPTASPEIDVEIRVWKVEGFPKILIFYHADGGGLSVVRVLHGSRDLPPLVLEAL